MPSSLVRWLAKKKVIKLPNISSGPRGTLLFLDSFLASIAGITIRQPMRLAKNKATKAFSQLPKNNPSPIPSL